MTPTSSKRSESLYPVMEEKFAVRVYGKSELARKYGVSPKILGNWIARLRKFHPDIFPEKEDKHKHLLTPAQVKKIVEHVGEP